MKIKIATFAAVFASVAVVCAAETTETMAVTAARNWAAANAGSFAPAGDVVSASAERDSDGTLLWWTVAFSGGGAVVAAPDTRIEPIISVIPSYSGSIPDGHPLRTMLTLDIRNRLNVLGEEGGKTASSGGLRLGAGGGSDAAGAGKSLPPDVAASAVDARAKWAELAPSGPVRLKVTPIYDPEAPAYILGICPGFEMGGVYTHWDQGNSPYSLLTDGIVPEQDATVRKGTCYNYHTPRHAVCGCVATAGAAMMQYFGNHGPTYNAVNMISWGIELPPGNPYSYTEELAMIGATNNYDWAILPENFGGTNVPVYGAIDKTYLTTEQVDLLGRATFDMGVAVGMMYDANGTSGSGSMLTDLANSFRRYFGFQDARCAWMVCTNATPDGIAEDKPANIEAGGVELYNLYGSMADLYSRLIYSQVRNGIPVPLGIFSPEAGGHAVIACGYGRDKAGTSYTRVFMGWAGNDDAWYCLPVIQSFPVLRSCVTMTGRDDCKTVPVVGRVVTSSGDGAAYVNVDVGGVTNVMTDASGYWAARIDGAGRSFTDDVVVYESTTTNHQCRIGDVEAVEKVDEIVDEGGRNISFSAKLAGGDVVMDAYKYVSTVSKVEYTEELPGGGTTNCVAVEEHVVVNVKQCKVAVSCNGVSEDVGIGAYSFDTEGETFESRVAPLVASIPDEVELVLQPSDIVLTAFPGTERPENVISNALETGRKILMISGHSGTEAYNTILGCLSDMSDEVGKEYVLYIIDPEKDTYTLRDGDPSFGVFDPYIFNSSAPDRWAFYNGRLAYFNVTNGVTYADIQAVLDEGAVQYAKIHSGITITVDPGADDILTNGFEMTTTDKNGNPTNVIDWKGQTMSGYGVFTECFTNNQTVVFTAPSAATNANCVMEVKGWSLFETKDTETIDQLHNLWVALSEFGDTFRDLYWNEAFNEPYPDPFAPPASSGLMWVASDPANPDETDRAEIDLAGNAEWTLRWWWEKTKIRISVSAVDCVVSTNDVPITDGAVWVPYSADGSDTVEFKATGTAVAGSFKGWIIQPSCDGVDASKDTIEIPADNAYSIKAVYIKDNGFYNINYSSNPADLSVGMKATVDGMEYSLGDDNSGDIAYTPCSVTLEMPKVATNVVGDVTNVLYCAGWIGTGSVPAYGLDNSCTFVLTNNTTIVWQWSEEIDPKKGNPYCRDNVRLVVAAGDNAPDVAFEPEVGLHEMVYTNGQTIVCSTVSGITNETLRTASICEGWTLTDADDNVIDSGDGPVAEITFEENAYWTLTWKWRTTDLVRIVVRKTIPNNADQNLVAVDDWFPQGEIAEIDLTSGNDALTLNGFNGDTNGCSVAGALVDPASEYQLLTRYVLSVPADADREIVLNFSKGNTTLDKDKLTIAQVHTNDASGVSVDWGGSKPLGCQEEVELAANNLVIMNMSGSPYTNIVDDVTNIWVCSGWRLYRGSTNLLVGDVIEAGTGTTAAFTIKEDSSLVWIWMESSEISRSPLPDKLEGPTLGGNTPLVVGDHKVSATIANTAKGWWYGLYSSTVLTSNPADWTLVPGMKKLAAADGEIIEFETEWDPAEPQKFFKIIVTEDEP